MLRTKRSVIVLIGAAGLNLLAGAAVATGIVPQLGSEVHVAAEGPAVFTPPEGVATPAPEVPAEGVDVPATPTETVPPVTAAPAASAAATPRVAEAAPAEPEVQQSTPTPTAPPVTLPPRVAVSSAQVLQVIGQLGQSIPLFRLANEAQGRQFGDTVCTAFDGGSSYGEVKAGVLSAARQIPLVTVRDADADVAIRAAVNLFCPGHLSKLS